jgi:hypothetical protein
MPAHVAVHEYGHSLVSPSIYKNDNLSKELGLVYSNWIKDPKGITCRYSDSKKTLSEKIDEFTAEQFKVYILDDKNANFYAKEVGLIIDKYMKGEEK